MPRDLGQRAQDFRERWVRFSSPLETISNIHQTKSSTILARTLRRMALRSHDYRFRCDRGMGHHHPLWLLRNRMDCDTNESYRDFYDPCFGFDLAIPLQYHSEP